ncbi:ankyrin repeat domain-containing protein [Thiotrichales bacterium 19S9-12]|nr:ankyrin repeat domain-containing protein [Thiotrichales bacterium 19S9-11]MCF6811538.1 ankyrin repeat domain-containing protein [Thiotrichales bacterium 19S9-12]
MPGEEQSLIQRKLKISYKNLIKNDFGNTELHIAAKNGDVEKLKKLLNIYHIDCIDKVVNSHGHTPLYMAALFGQLDVCKYLLENTNSFVLKSTKAGDNPLTIAFTEKKLETFNCLADHLIKEFGPNAIEIQLINLQSFLHHAIDFGSKREEFVSSLIKRGGNVYQKRLLDGKTPLDLAEEKDFHDVIKLITIKVVDDEVQKKIANNEQKNENTESEVDLSSNNQDLFLELQEYVNLEVKKNPTPFSSGDSEGLIQSKELTK